MRILGRIITVVIAVVVTIVALAAGYMVYLNVNSKRLPDRAELAITEVAESVETDESAESGETGEADESSGADASGEADGPSGVDGSDGSDASDAEDQAEDDLLPKLQTGQEYRALTYNVGFGAFNHEYSFFMSEGRLADGKKTKGLMSRADSEKSVNDTIEAAIAAVLAQRPDIAIFQEVDKSAGRSYRIDELRMISRAFEEGAVGDGGAANGSGDGADEYIEDIDAAVVNTNEATDDGGPFAEIYATNFHTGWLLWPPAHPMGMIRDSGMATYSRYAIDAAERLSLPVVGSFPAKFFDLDRCFTVARLPVEGAGSAAGDDSDTDTDAGTDSSADADADADSGPAGGDGDDGPASASSDENAELVFINVHLSAYKAGDRIRGEQMQKLAGVMEEERAKGNWVVVGGDWNQCFPGSDDAFPGRMKKPEWAKQFDEEALPDNFSIIDAYNADVIATCRDSSIPWTPGVSYETIIDGWIVSDNVDAVANNVDTDYAASDHNPVLLTFTLH